MRLFVRIGFAVVLIGAIGGGAAFASWGPSAARLAPRQPNSGGLVASRTTDGLRITLQVLRRWEPVNALIRSRLTVANVSRRPIDLIDNGCFPAASVQVLDARDEPYPPPAFTAVWDCAHSPRVLEPGARLTSSPLVVLESSRLRPEVTVIAAGTSRRLTRSIIRLHLMRVPVPRVVVHSGSSGRSGAGFIASVLPAWRHSGPLYVESLESCVQANGGGSQTCSPYWHSVKGFTVRTSILDPTCHTQLWHFYAGWIGASYRQVQACHPEGEPARLLKEQPLMPRIHLFTNDRSAADWDSPSIILA